MHKAGLMILVISSIFFEWFLILFERVTKDFNPNIERSILRISEPVS